MQTMLPRCRSAVNRSTRLVLVEVVTITVAVGCSDNAAPVVEDASANNTISFADGAYSGYDNDTPRTDAGFTPRSDAGFVSDTAASSSVDSTGAGSLDAGSGSDDVASATDSATANDTNTCVNVATLYEWNQPNPQYFAEQSLAPDVATARLWCASVAPEGQWRLPRQEEYEAEMAHAVGSCKTLADLAVPAFIHQVHWVDADPVDNQSLFFLPAANQLALYPLNNGEWGAFVRCIRDR